MSVYPDKYYSPWGGSGGGLVTSIFGRIGVVVATLGDYAASLITNDSSAIGATVKDALNGLAPLFNAKGNITGATVIDVALGSVQSATLTGNVTMTFSNMPAGPKWIQLQLTQDGAGGKSLVITGAKTSLGGGSVPISTAGGTFSIVSVSNAGGVLTAVVAGAGLT